MRGYLLKKVAGTSHTYTYCHVWTCESEVTTEPVPTNLEGPLRNLDLQNRRGTYTNNRGGYLHV